MWQITIARLLVATFWCAVALAGILAKTHQPYGMVVGSLALTFAAMTVVDPRSRLARSERATLIVLVSLQLGFLFVIGLAFALLGR